MKKDFLTAIIVAIVGGVAGFLVCNLILGEVQEVSVKGLDSSFSVDIAEPNIELFNYRAINPTVEVYIGNKDCQEYDANGQCIYGNNQNSSSEENSNGDGS